MSWINFVEINIFLAVPGLQLNHMGNITSSPYVLECNASQNIILMLKAKYQKTNAKQ
jgi:hypothetical protein